MADNSVLFILILGCGSWKKMKIGCIVQTWVMPISIMSILAEIIRMRSH